MSEAKGLEPETKMGKAEGPEPQKNASGEVIQNVWRNIL